MGEVEALLQFLVCVMAIANWECAYTCVFGVLVLRVSAVGFIMNVESLIYVKDFIGCQQESMFDELIICRGKFNNLTIQK